MAFTVLDLAARKLGMGSAAKRLRKHLGEKAKACLFEVFLIIKEEVLLIMA